MSDPSLFDQPLTTGSGVITGSPRWEVKPLPVYGDERGLFWGHRPRPIEPSIQERFYAFDQTNPHVYVRLEQMTAQLVARGRRRVGMKMLFEVLRWEHALSTDDPTSEFRLNNVYSSRYSRKLMDAHPEWEGIFETRELKA